MAVVITASRFLRGVGVLTGNSSSEDAFRIKISDKDDNDTVVYDNEIGEADDADPTTVISGGSIKIHEGK